MTNNSFIMLQVHRQHSLHQGMFPMSSMSQVCWEYVFHSPGFRFEVSFWEYNNIVMLLPWNDTRAWSVCFVHHTIIQSFRLSNFALNT